MAAFVGISIGCVFALLILIGIYKVRCRSHDYNLYSYTLVIFLLLNKKNIKHGTKELFLIPHSCLGFELQIFDSRSDDLSHSTEHSVRVYL